MSSAAADPSALSTSIASLPRSVLESAIAPLLTTAALLTLASADRVTRRLVLTQSLWRNRAFKVVPAVASASTPPLPSLQAVVQVVTILRRPRRAAVPTDWPLSLSSLVGFTNLRYVRIDCTDQLAARKLLHGPAVTSLAALRHLTCIALEYGGTLAVWELKALSTLPVLVSFVASVDFDAGSEETLAEWLAASSKRRGTKRKVVGYADKEDGKQTGGVHVEIEGKEGDEQRPDSDQHQSDEHPVDPILMQLHSPLLLFLHALAAKPSFVHLHVGGITPFVMDHMPVWPHLLCFAVRGDHALRLYSFVGAAARFPSLTSLSSPSCHDAAIEQLVRLPRLEELRFPDYTISDQNEGCVETTEHGFRAFSQAASLRSVQYTPPERADGECYEREEPPSLTSLTALCSLTHLTRLTVGAHWLPEEACAQLFTQHRFVHLRCLELIAQYDGEGACCPQTDSALLALVKPADTCVRGRELRQAARAAKRNAVEELDRFVEGEQLSIPANNAANFPVLECLALPYHCYNDGDCSVKPSAWMRRQLRRSYEYEVAAEWEAEVGTLGEAELVRLIRAGVEYGRTMLSGEVSTRGI